MASLSIADRPPKLVPLDVHPLQRKHRLLLRRLRARQMLQRMELDRYYTQQADSRSARQLIMEDISQLTEDLSVARARNEPTVLMLSAQLTEARLEVANLAAAIKAGEPEEERVSVLRRGLVIRQFRERAALARKLGLELRGVPSGAVAAAAALGFVPAMTAAEGTTEDAEDSSAGDVAAATAAAEAASSSSAALRHTAASVLNAATVGAANYCIGVHACHRCASHFPRGTGTACNDCNREFCGRGGRSETSPLAWPCVDIYKCSCGTHICHDCFTSTETRACSFWRHCEACDRFMCPKECDARDVECDDCGMEPLCRGCRASHTGSCRGSGMASGSRGRKGGD